MRAYDVFGWNMNLITNQIDLLRQCHADCAAILEQVNVYFSFSLSLSLSLSLSVLDDDVNASMNRLMMLMTR